MLFIAASLAMTVFSFLCRNTATETIKCYVCSQILHEWCRSVLPGPSEKKCQTACTKMLNRLKKC